MAIKIYSRGNYVYVEQPNNKDFQGTKSMLTVDEPQTGSGVFIIYWRDRVAINSVRLADLVDEFDVPWTAQAFKEWYEEDTGLTGTEEQPTVVTNPDINFTNGGLDVILQDSTSPTFSLFFSQSVLPPTTIVNTLAKGDTECEVVDATGIVLGMYLGIVSMGRYYFSDVIGINGNIVSLDTPIDYEFPAGSIALKQIKNMNVDGSVTPQIFQAIVGSSGLSIDITRFILTVRSAEEIQLENFGDMPSLLKGIVIRQTNGEWRNIFNFKSNAEMITESDNWEVFTQTRPNDINAIQTSFTFGGQSNRGAVIRLGTGDAIQCVIQEDLTSLLSVQIIVQGSEVVD